MGRSHWEEKMNCMVENQIARNSVWVRKACSVDPIWLGETTPLARIISDPSQPPAAERGIRQLVP
jgi:hypothetical protein